MDFSAENLQAPCSPPARGESDEEQASGIFDGVKAELLGPGLPPVTVSFYPYTSIRAVITRRGDRIRARLSDALRHAPADTKRALAAILLCRLGKQPVPEWAEREYRAYMHSPHIVALAASLRRMRATKSVDDGKGEGGRHRSLRLSFDRVNAEHFNGLMRRPRLAWNKKRTRTRLGHEDSALETVVISRSLDSARVPEFVLDYVMYHELLHRKLGISYGGKRRGVHTREFKSEEKKFTMYDEAIRWLRENRL